MGSSVELELCQVRRLLSNLKPDQLEISPDSKVFALKSRVFALLGAKALDFGAKTLEILWNLDPKSRVFAPKSRVFALLGAKALDFGAKALDFFDFPIKSPVKFQVGWVLSWMGAVPLENYQTAQKLRNFFV